MGKVSGIKQRKIESLIPYENNAKVHSDQQKEKDLTEKERLENIIKEAGVSEARQRALAPIVENTAWMREKLDDAREKIASSSVVIPYDSGGGQSGIRENPLYKGYENLWKSYLTGLDRIMSALPPEKSHEIVEEAEKTEPSTVLSLVRKRKKKEA